MAHYALEAADRVAEDGISAEVVDLRTLRPLDRETLLDSVRKTGKCLVVYEDNKFGGYGAEVAAIVAEEAFDYLDGPVTRIAGPEVPGRPVQPRPRGLVHGQPGEDRRRDPEARRVLGLVAGSAPAWSRRSPRGYGCARRRAPLRSAAAGGMPAARSRHRRRRTGGGRSRGRARPAPARFHHRPAVHRGLGDDHHRRDEQQESQVRASAGSVSRSCRPPALRSIAGRSPASISDRAGRIWSRCGGAAEMSGRRRRRRWTVSELAASPSSDDHGHGLIEVSRRPRSYGRRPDVGSRRFSGRRERVLPADE